MNSCSPTRTVERARPLLGTTVVIRVDETNSVAHAHEAIDGAFAAMAKVHREMSFHESGSELSSLHRAPAGTRVDVSLSTVAVLREALRLAELSDGAFDVTIGTALVERGLLPTPETCTAPTQPGSWRDIEVFDDGVRLRQPLWIDLGGIAKGYAVDQAVLALREAGIAHGCVDAGGDLRTLGQGPHRAAIATGLPTDQVAVIELGEAALATSSGRAFASRGAHLDPRTGMDTALDRCATVIAGQCIHADALTKVVLALGSASEPVLRQYGAVAYLQNSAGDWTVMGASP